MPTNLPPEAMDKWELVEAAHTPKEKMDAMIEFLKYVPHHKGTMKLRGEMNRKIALIRDDLEKKKRQGTGKSSGGPKLFIEKEGSAQIALVGMTNVGKSALMTAVTNSKVLVTPTPFSTHEPVPGIMSYKDVQFQIVEGLGLANLRKVPTDADFRMDPAALEGMIAEDRGRGRLPLAVVATAGTTSTTSVDPLRPIADICRRETLWLHVDAAYAGSAAICPEFRQRFDGIEDADSIVVNPHKWLFTPVDCSLLFVRDAAQLRAAFSLVPEYLRTDDEGVTNLMDYGIQLGRRFRALKLWMVIRAFGVSGLRDRIRFHCALAQELAGWVRAEPGFELVAPVPFSVVCFRLVRGATPEEEDRLNERLLAEVNAAGPVFLSHTRLRDRLVLRVAIGNLRTTRAHVEKVWELVRRAAARLSAPSR